MNIPSPVHFLGLMLSEIHNRLSSADVAIAVILAILAGLVALFLFLWRWEARLGDARSSAVDGGRRAENHAEAYRKMLDALPVAVWREEQGALTWGNAAFLRTLGARSIEDAMVAGGLDWCTRVGETREAGGLGETRRTIVVGGRSRTFTLGHWCVDNGTMGGVALDITALAGRETMLNLELAAHAEMMERLPLAFAVFDAGRRLTGYNGAYARLWGLSDAWLDSHPRLDEILDRLRYGRKLPEQRNFSQWKLEQDRLFEGIQDREEALWHLPGGKSLRVISQPHLSGGMFMLFDDITERLQLESSAVLLTQVQRAILDSADDAISIFGPDGRLFLYNRKFAAIWRLGEEELSGDPHFAQIASWCTDRIGRDGVWDMVSRGVNSATSEGLEEWGKARRADGKLFSVVLRRLPSGATMVTFCDLTDLERFGAELGGKDAGPRIAGQAAG